MCRENGHTRNKCNSAKAIWSKHYLPRVILMNSAGRQTKKKVWNIGSVRGPRNEDDAWDRVFEWFEFLTDLFNDLEEEDFIEQYRCYFSNNEHEEERTTEEIKEFYLRIEDIIARTEMPEELQTYRADFIAFWTTERKNMVIKFIDEEGTNTDIWARSIHSYDIYVSDTFDPADSVPHFREEEERLYPIIRERIRVANEAREVRRRHYQDIEQRIAEQAGAATEVVLEHGVSEFLQNTLTERYGKEIFGMRVFEKEKCMICLENIETENYKTGKCGHSFCRECVKGWVTSSRKCECPTCKQDY